MIVQSENWWLYRDVTRQTNNCSVWSAFESVLTLWWWIAHLRRDNFCHRNPDSCTRTTASPRPQWLACSTLARWVLRIRVVSVHDGSVWQRQLCHAAGRSLYGLPLLGWDLDAICGVITGTLDLESHRVSEIWGFSMNKTRFWDFYGSDIEVHFTSSISKPNLYPCPGANCNRLALKVMVA